MDRSLSKLQKTVKDREAGVMQSVGSQRVRHDWVTEEQQQSKVEDMHKLLLANPSPRYVSQAHVEQEQYYSQ